MLEGHTLWSLMDLQVFATVASEEIVDLLIVDFHHGHLLEDDEYKAIATTSTVMVKSISSALDVSWTSSRIARRFTPGLSSGPLHTV